jgi:hypothetical protein
MNDMTTAMPDPLVFTEAPPTGQGPDRVAGNESRCAFRHGRVLSRVRYLRIANDAIGMKNGASL